MIKELPTDEILNLFKSIDYLNNKEKITLRTTYEMQINKNEFPAIGNNYKQLKQVVPELLKRKLIDNNTLKFCGVIRLTKKGIKLNEKFNLDA